MRTIPVVLWVGGCCLTVPFSFLSFPKQRMGQRSCIWKEKAQSTTSTGTMLHMAFSVIRLPPVYRRKCPDSFCAVYFCSSIGVLISKYNSLVQESPNAWSVFLLICWHMGRYRWLTGIKLCDSCVLQVTVQCDFPSEELTASDLLLDFSSTAHMIIFCYFMYILWISIYIYVFM